jgi:hypothetical protein
MFLSNLFRLLLVHGFVLFCKSIRTPAKVSFLIAGLENATVLHKHSDPPREMERKQQTLHGCGENFCRPDLAPEFHEVLPLVQVIRITHGYFIPVARKTIHTFGDRIATNFSGQGWMAVELVEISPFAE